MTSGEAGRRRIHWKFSPNPAASKTASKKPWSTLSKALDGYKLIRAALTSTFSIIVQTKWILSWIVLPLTEQHCSGPIRLARAVRKWSVKIFAKLFKSVFSVVNRRKLQILHVGSCEETSLYPWWSVKGSSPASTSCYRQSPARRKAASTLRREDHRFRLFCLSWLFYSAC